MEQQYEEQQDVYEMGDTFEDDGFSSYEEDSPNRVEIEHLKEPELPEVVTKVIKWILDRVFAIVVITICVTILIAGFYILHIMYLNRADVGGIKLMNDMLNR